ncbi:unnamed protein product, partial [Porites evermanni]
SLSLASGNRTVREEIFSSMMTHLKMLMWGATSLAKRCCHCHQKRYLKLHLYRCQV